MKKVIALSLVVLSFSSITFANQEKRKLTKVERKEIKAKQKKASEKNSRRVEKIKYDK